MKGLSNDLTNLIVNGEPLDELSIEAGKREGLLGLKFRWFVREPRSLCENSLIAFEFK